VRAICNKQSLVYNYKEPYGQIRPMKNRHVGYTSRNFLFTEQKEIDHVIWLNFSENFG